MPSSGPVSCVPGDIGTYEVDVLQQHALRLIEEEAFVLEIGIEPVIELCALLARDGRRDDAMRDRSWITIVADRRAYLVQAHRTIRGVLHVVLARPDDLHR